MFDDPVHPLFNKCNEVDEAIESISFFANAASVKEGRLLREGFTLTTTIERKKAKISNSNYKDGDNDRNDRNDRNNNNNNNNPSDSDSDSYYANNNINLNINTNNINNNQNNSAIRSRQSNLSMNASNRNPLESLDKYRFCSDYAQNALLNSQINKMPLNAPKTHKNKNKNASKKDNFCHNWQQNNALSTLEKDNDDMDVSQYSGYEVDDDQSSIDNNKNRNKNQSKKKKAKKKPKKKPKRKKGADSDEEYCPQRALTPQLPRKSSRRTRSTPNYNDEQSPTEIEKEQDAQYEEKINTTIVCSSFLCVFMYVDVVIEF